MSGRGIDGRSIPGGGARGIPRVAGLPADKAAGKLEAVARDQERAIGELSAAAQAAEKAAEKTRHAAEAAAPRVIADITLADGAETTVTHNLGRKPSFVRESCPRGVDPTVVVAATGRVVAVPSVATTAYDETKDVVLKASGWGVAVVVDLLVVP